MNAGKGSNPISLINTKIDTNPPIIINTNCGNQRIHNQTVVTDRMIVALKICLFSLVSGENIANM